MTRSRHSALLQMLSGLCWLLVLQGVAVIASEDAPRRIREAREPARALLADRLAAEQLPAPDYIGTAQCILCHTSRLEGLPRSHPALLEYGADPAWRGNACEACHGPGSAHTVGGGNAEGILHPLKLTGEQSDAVCLSCHAGTQWGTTHDWHGAPHAQAGLACVSCHDPHQEHPALLRPLDAGTGSGTRPLDGGAASPLILGPPFAGPASAVREYAFNDPQRSFPGMERFCLSCHAEVAQDFRMRSHHPLEQAGFSCTTCHDPHQQAVRGADLIRQTNALCESCHGEYAGPFVFPHAPVHDVTLGDGCLTCHQPHGSTQPHLLTISGRATCLQCHVDRDTTGPTPHFAGSCWAAGCHVQIHGSHTDLYFMERPLISGMMVNH